MRSFSTTGSTTTALWVNRDLAQKGSEEISSVLMLKRVEPCESAKTAEGRRVRKELAIFTVEEDIGVSPKTLQMEQIRSLAMRGISAEECLQDPGLVHQHLPAPTTKTPAAAVPNTTPATTSSKTKGTANAIPPVPSEVHCHHPVPPVPSFGGSGASSLERTISCSSSSALHHNNCASQVSSVSNSDCPPDHIETLESSEDEKDSAGAAHLLLMLSKGQV